MEGQEQIPWQALRYLTGEVVYGGRVTDSWDRRCLNCILQMFYTPEILQEGHRFSADGIYHIISENMDQVQCVNYIESLPEYDLPDIFGMHPDAEKTFLESQSQLFMETVVSIQPRLSISGQLTRGGKSSHEIVLEVALDILKRVPRNVGDEKLPEGIERVKAPKITLAELLTLPLWIGYVQSINGFDSLANSALLTVLRQEIDRFNHLLEVILKSIRSLCFAVKGQSILTVSLEEVYNSCLNMKVPKLWKLCSYESCKPLGSWIDDLIQRVNFFSTWSDNLIRVAQQKLRIIAKEQGKRLEQIMQPISEQPGKTYQAQPCAFWLSGFFFPQGFLTAVLQNHARQHGIPVDTLTFTYYVQQPSRDDSLVDVTRKASACDSAFSQDESNFGDGVLVFGLYLDGAHWNAVGQSIEESKPGKRYCKMPSIHFLPVKIEKNKKVDELEEEVQEAYECPVYRTSQRAGILSATGLSTNFVTSVILPSQHPFSHWVTRGVALLCQLDD
uniref:Dynein heavy chain C-terminal domain-containing protein n=1 Tax=Callorhinchus milii TaxID=7868 RepID=A0A4W3JPJ3_CALMI